MAHTRSVPHNTYTHWAKLISSNLPTAFFFYEALAYMRFACFIYIIGTITYDMSYFYLHERKLLFYDAKKLTIKNLNRQHFHGITCHSGVSSFKLSVSRLMFNKVNHGYGMDILHNIYEEYIQYCAEICEQMIYLFYTLKYMYIGVPERHRSNYNFSNRIVGNRHVEIQYREEI